MMLQSESQRKKHPQPLVKSRESYESIKQKEGLEK